jgi:phosphopentomutase
LFKRVIIIVLDSVGVGALPDAKEYGDEGANTLFNVAEAAGGLLLPALSKLGLGFIEPARGLSKEAASACYGKMAQLSKGKDTISGHWELVGYPVMTPFPVYPDGFPHEVIESFKMHTGTNILGNKAASGTEIIFELGEEHFRTGYPIVYTSADSVFQIAAHEEVIPLWKLYEFCKIAREKVCVGKHSVGRVIARPFIGSAGEFVRTANRHDYSTVPPEKTMLDILKEAGLESVGIGKISDIFAGEGLTQSFSTTSNDDGMRCLTECFRQMKKENKSGLVMINLVDFDSKYGHRNDAPGYARALEEFDSSLTEFLPALSSDDLLIITADHGCDPTMPGTDHTREYVPILAYSPEKRGKNLGVRETFADVAATVLENFALPPPKFGKSFLKNILEN